MSLHGVAARGPFVNMLLHHSTAAAAAYSHSAVDDDEVIEPCIATMLDNGFLLLNPDEGRRIPQDDEDMYVDQPQY